MFDKMFYVLREALSYFNGLWYALILLFIITTAFTVCVIVKNKEIFKFITLDGILFLSLIYILSGYDVNKGLAVIISLTLLSSILYSFLKIVPIKEEDKSIKNFIKSLDEKINKDKMLESEEYKSILTGEDEILIKKLKTSNVICEDVNDVNLEHASKLTERLFCYALSESDERKVKEINDAIVDATLKRTSVENLNEKLSSLVRMLAKYNA